MSGFSFGCSSASSSSQSTPAFSLSNAPSSISSFGSATATSSSPFGFGSSTSTSSSSSASSFSFPFNSAPSPFGPTSGSPLFGATSSSAAPTSGSPLFGTTPSSAAPTSGSPLFGTTSSPAAPTSDSSLFGTTSSTAATSGFGSTLFGTTVSSAGTGLSPFGTSSSASPFSTSSAFSKPTTPSAASSSITTMTAKTSATSGFALFGTASSASMGFSRFGTSSSDSPFPTSTTLSASSSCSSLIAPAFRFSPGSFSSSSSAPAFGDAGDEGEQVALEVVKNPMCPNSVEEAKNVSAAAASKAFSAVDEEESAETSPLSSLFVEVDRHAPSPHNISIIKRILQKHGDITNGSILRSLEAKWAFLDLIGDVVNRLCNHTLETLCSHELQLMEANVADAVAVGFKVEWLQQRVDEIKAAKHQACSKELDEMDIQIEAAKTSLMEMELRREDLARDVAAINAKIEGKGFLGCTLSEGLL